MTAFVSGTKKTNCLNLCSGDMNRKASLESRAITAPKIGQTKSTITFSVIAEFWCKVVTTNESKRFAGVVTEDKTTHTFVTRWTSKVDKLDGDGEHFIRMKNKRNGTSTLYKVEGIADYNEQNDWVAFVCSERGLDGNEETDA